MKTNRQRGAAARSFAEYEQQSKVHAKIDARPLKRRQRRAAAVLRLIPSPADYAAAGVRVARPCAIFYAVGGNVYAPIGAATEIALCRDQAAALALAAALNRTVAEGAL